MNDINTYVELRYFPVKLSKEYLSILPNYVLYTLCHKVVTRSIPVYRDETISRIMLYIWMQNTADKYLNGTVERIVRNDLIEYYSHEELYSNTVYFIDPVQ